MQAVLYEDHVVGLTDADEFVEFVRSGVGVKGEFRCSECGYGVVVSRSLPPCPMCGEDVWEPVAWRPVSTLWS